MQFFPNLQNAFAKLQKHNKTFNMNHHCNVRYGRMYTQRMHLFLMGKDKWQHFQFIFVISLVCLGQNATGTCKNIFQTFTIKGRNNKSTQ